MNTGPLIALVAAVGDLSILGELYRQVLVPYEVAEEMRAGGKTNFAVEAFERAEVVHVWPRPVSLPPLLANSLDRGEASVIQLALDEKVPTVGIDEAVGRRFARLSGLKLTGSLGILIRAKREGLNVSLETAIHRMRGRGIYLSENLTAQVLEQAGEG